MIITIENGCLKRLRLHEKKIPVTLEARKIPTGRNRRDGYMNN